MRLTTADLVVLAVLLFDRQMHGYELVAKLEESHVEDWAAISKPQVYYSLRKLAENGFLKSSTDGENSLGPDRIVYKATAKATDAMLKALQDSKWVKRHAPVPFTTWSVLALHAPPEVVCQTISERAKILESEIKKEKKTFKSFGNNYKEANINVARVLVEIAIKQFEVELESLGDLKKAILTGKT